MAVSIYAFPSHILKIIREYSSPITRSNWRNIHKITNYNFFYCITNDNIPYRLLTLININMQKSINWCKKHNFTVNKEFLSE